MLRCAMSSSSSVVSDEPLHCQEPCVDTSESTQDKQDSSANTQAIKSTTSDTGKVPKWLKLPGEEGAHSENTHTQLCLFQTSRLVLFFLTSYLRITTATNKTAQNKSRNEWGSCSIYVHPFFFFHSSLAGLQLVLEWSPFLSFLFNSQVKSQFFHGYISSTMWP